MQTASLGTVNSHDFSPFGDSSPHKWEKLWPTDFSMKIKLANYKYFFNWLSSNSCLERRCYKEPQNIIQCLQCVTKWGRSKPGIRGSRDLAVLESPLNHWLSLEAKHLLNEEDVQGRVYDVLFDPVTCSAKVWLSPALMSWALTGESRHIHCLHAPRRDSTQKPAAALVPAASPMHPKESCGEWVGVIPEVSFLTNAEFVFALKFTNSQLLGLSHLYPLSHSAPYRR